MPFIQWTLQTHKCRLMRGEVSVPFRDKFNFDLKHEVGEEVEFDDERMEFLFANGYCKRLEEQKAPAPSKPKAKKESKKKVLDETKDDDVKEEVTTDSENVTNNEPDEKAKSEQEAQAKIAEALAKAEK